MAGQTTTVGGTSALALVIAWAAGYFGIADLGAETAIAFAGVLITAATYVGRKGLRGIARAAWRGSGRS